MKDLRKHFRIAPADALDCPAGWSSDRVQGFDVQRGGDLRLYPLSEGQGALLGWVIGGAEGIYPDGTVLEGPGATESYAQWSHSLSGRYVCLLEGKLYTDAGGLLGAVYAPSLRSVAATPTLIPDAEDDAELIAVFGVPEHHGWYPFGLTPKRGVKRLMPNFALDLEDFTIQRYWPGAAQDTGQEDAVLEDIASAITAGITGLANWPKIAAHLTAGYDSRMILAAAWPLRHKINFVTIGGIPGTGSDLDAGMAKRLADQFGLTHEIRPFVPPESGDVAIWYERTGYCISDHVTKLTSTLRRWDQEEVQIGGTAGEVARAFYWDASDIGCAAPDVSELVRRLGQPDVPAVRAAAAEWLASLPPLSAPLLWDIAYIEQRLGCWGGPSVYGAGQPVPSLVPFNTREIFGAMLRLPEAYRAGGQFPVDLMRRADTELLKLPFNRPVGLDILRDPKGWAKAVLPKSVKMRLKEILGR